MGGWRRRSTGRRGCPAVVTSLATALQLPIASLPFVLHVAGVALALALAGYAARDRSSPGVGWFAAWAACTAAWLAVNAVGLLVLEPATRNVVQSVALAVTPVTATTWFAFGLAYTGRGAALTTFRLRALAAVAVVLSAVALTNPLHGWVVSDLAVQHVAGVAAVPGFQPRAGFWLVSGYVYLLFAGGLVALVDLVISGDRLYADQAAALLLAVGLPLVAAVAFVTGRSPVPIDPTPLASAVSAGPLAYAVFRARLLELVPAFHRVGERQAVHALEEGLLVVDPAGRVVVVNARMASILDADRAAIRGRPVDELIEASRLEPTARWTAETDDRWTDRPDSSPAGREDQPDERDGPVPPLLRDPRTGRTYSTTASRIEEGDASLGEALVVRDVTEERRRKQRLLVLNRVVRHNLRNDMTVLLGHSRMLGAENEESLAVIEEIGTDLVALGEKAQEIDRIIRESAAPDRTVDVAGIVERVVEHHRETAPGVTIDASVPDQAWTESHGRVIEAIVSNLVENAVEHGAGGGIAGAVDGSERAPDEEPTVSADGHGAATVSVDLERRPDRLELVVADDGPGVPRDELAAIGDGEVSDLHHASGLGLWMVKWCVDLADAHWTIDTESGTRITVSFPRAGGGAERDR